MTDGKTETQKQIESIRLARESNQKYGYSTRELEEIFGTGDG
ncbi:hypothetical protein [Halogeometricum salsisoli]|nr:hypothetical protein [Halogeometricum sp. S1BR25-6]